MDHGHRLASYDTSLVGLVSGGVDFCIILTARSDKSVDYVTNNKQELSYRKQIARKLRAHYVEGIYDSPVTLKSRLTVTQGHWKRNH